jgi:hypothetical protein
MASNSIWKVPPRFADLRGSANRGESLSHFDGHQDDGFAL